MTYNYITLTKYSNDPDAPLYVSGIQETDLLITPVPENMILLPSGVDITPDMLMRSYDKVLGVFGDKKPEDVLPSPTISNTKLTKFQFRSKFTLQELVAIDNADTNGDLSVSQKATLNTIGKNFVVAEDIDLAHPQTIQGIQYLASVGLLTPERATEILTP
jgi:hypothetical protein